MGMVSRNCGDLVLTDSYMVIQYVAHFTKIKDADSTRIKTG